MIDDDRIAKEASEVIKDPELRSVAYWAIKAHLKKTALKRRGKGETMEPLEFEGLYLWHNRDHKLAAPGEYSDHLPQPVFDRLDGFMPRPNPLVTEIVKAYPSREAAMAALARAFA